MIDVGAQFIAPHLPFEPYLGRIILANRELYKERDAFPF